jgi:uncharacterized membrane protein YqaE (UPF0057 family)
MRNLLLTVLFFTVLFSSCTIEKRHYMNGYHIEWNHANRKEKATGTDVAIQRESLPAQTEEPALVLAETAHAKPAAEVVTDLPSNADIQPTITSTSVAEKAAEHSMRDGNGRAEARRRHANGYRNFQSRVFHAQSAISTEQSVSDSSMIDDILLIILAIFVSPLAVYLHEGTWNTTCWINLILWLLFILPGFIHALIVILG